LLSRAQRCAQNVCDLSRRRDDSAPIDEEANIYNLTVEPGQNVASALASALTSYRLDGCGSAPF